MSLTVQKDKIRLNKITHAVRASQAVLQYGVGAMVDFPDQTLMTAAPEYWQERVEQIHDERLEKALKVDYFGMPGNKDEIKYAEGISYVRFPEWYFCPKCRRFQPLSSWIADYKRSAKQKELDNDPFMVKHMKCPTDHQNLVVARIITACEHGHISDFPWVEWVHCQNIGGAKKVCGNPKLTFKTGASSTEGLEGLEVACETCHARATLKGAFDKGKLEALDKKYAGEYRFHCKGCHPWKHTRESCNLYPRVLQRGSSSVYFPVIASSLVIPPYSSLLTTKIQNSTAFAKCKDSIADMLKAIPDDMLKVMPNAREMVIDSMINQYDKQIALEIGAPAEQVKAVLIRRWKSSEEEEYSTTSFKYRAEEYEALSGEVSISAGEYGDFQRESTDISDYHLPFLKSVSLIHKIREVQALTGFTRIKPSDRTESIEKQPNIVPVKEPETNWYPAYQVRGEGIFLEFDEDAINSWRSNNEGVGRRVEALNEKYKESFFGASSPRTISAKYLLLHTVSHLLIKQLSFECGYSIASLKERIYCADPSEGKLMSGILIYTASGDSEGTMGGLVRQGRPDVFPQLFIKAIESATTCSNDPVCSLSGGQGRESLNLAACYSCTLIPETSCEEFNIFLDRGVIVGTYNDRDMGFFSKQLYSDFGWDNSPSTNTGVPEDSAPRDKEIILSVGTDMSSVSYGEIWSALLQWTDNPTEKALLTELISHVAEFDGIEKPIQDCEFYIAGKADSYKCDYVWRKAKVMLFSAVNDEEYEAVKQTDWKCFLASDETVNWRTILSALEG